MANILKAHGFEPAPQRQRTGTRATFLRSHWDTLAAADFTTVKVWTRGGLVTFYVLMVMQLKTRRIQLAGITAQPDGSWVRQVTRNLTLDEDGFLCDTTHRILDRDTKILPLRNYLHEHTEVASVVLPPRSPNLNSYVERVFRSLREECLDRMIFFGERFLRHALRQWTPTTMRSGIMRG